MAISRLEKENLLRAKKADIQKLHYERDLLIDQKESQSKIKAIESKISVAKKELQEIEVSPEKDKAFDTQITINGGNIAQINTGENTGNIVQVNVGQKDFWNSINFSHLEKELSELHSKMKKIAKTDEQDIAVGEIAKAKKASSEKNLEKIIASLKSAGTWALDVATKIGVALATEALKIALGLR
jgi:cell division septal protein FtsQ